MGGAGVGYATGGQDRAATGEVGRPRQIQRIALQARRCAGEHLLRPGDVVAHEAAQRDDGVFGVVGAVLPVVVEVAAPGLPGAGLELGDAHRIAATLRRVVRHRVGIPARLQVDLRSDIGRPEPGAQRPGLDDVLEVLRRYRGVGPQRVAQTRLLRRGDRAAGSRRGHHQQAHAAQREQPQHDAGGDEQPPAAAALLAIHGRPARVGVPAANATTATAPGLAGPAGAWPCPRMGTLRCRVWGAERKTGHRRGPGRDAARRRPHPASLWQSPSP